VRPPSSPPPYFKGTLPSPTEKLKKPFRVTVRLGPGTDRDLRANAEPEGACWLRTLSFYFRYWSPSALRRGSELDFLTDSKKELGEATMAPLSPRAAPRPLHFPAFELDSHSPT
jgi:hypothetical protein